MKGIDVSTLQGVIDWKTAGKNIDFAMIKATQGRGEGAATRLLSKFTDSKFRQNVTACPVPRGVYHYFTATTKAKAYEEVDYFCKTIEPFSDCFSLWAALDVESKYLKGLGKTELTAIVRIALDQIKLRGFVPMLYTNPDFLTYRFEPHAFDDIDIWLAHYGVARPMSVPNLKIWQHSAGRVYGVSTDVDLDIGYFDGTPYSVGEKYTIRACDRYSNGRAVPARLVGKVCTISQVKPDRILLQEILSWVKT